jgi:peptide deformylase
MSSTQPTRLPVVAINETLLHLTEVALRQQCQPVQVNKPEEISAAQSIIREMFRTLYADASGVALAAPQIGVLLQIVVISFEDKEAKQPRLMALLNPKIVHMSSETAEDKEICLSVPNFAGMVTRAKEIEVEAFNQKGKPTNFSAEGFFARVVQHEVDHLNGILCVDRSYGKLEHVPYFPERRVGPTLKKLGLDKLP